jgi:hypothetical protein
MHPGREGGEIAELGNCGEVYAPQFPNSAPIPRDGGSVLIINDDEEEA